MTNEWWDGFSNGAVACVVVGRLLFALRDWAVEHNEQKARARASQPLLNAPRKAEE